jgi:hypothetical protein
MSGMFKKEQSSTEPTQWKKGQSGGKAMHKQTQWKPGQSGSQQTQWKPGQSGN